MIAATTASDRGAWDAFIAAHPSGHFFQSWDWGALQQSMDARPVRLVAADEGRAVGAAQMLVFEGSRRFAVVPRGPVVEPSGPAFEAILDAMLRACAADGVQLLRLEPQWADDPAVADTLRSRGFAEAKQHIMPPRTILVDLGPPVERIWSGFESTTRNRIRVAEKRGVTIRAGARADVDTFVRLTNETNARHGLRPSRLEQFVRAMELFGARDAMRLYLACDGDDILSGIMVFVWGTTATYLWGASASSDRARHLNPNQLLHWTAMQWARERGCVIYDLFGVPDFDAAVLEQQYASQTGGWWNLYRFKRGFGGAVHRHLGTFDARIASSA